MSAPPMNYLDHREINTLKRITVTLLDQAEFRPQGRQDIRMGDQEVILDKFIGETELPVPTKPGRISHQMLSTAPTGKMRSSPKTAAVRSKKRPKLGIPTN